MTRRATGTLVALVVGLGWSGLAAAQPADAPPIHTNKTRFRIPYRSDPAELQRLGAREIRLFVSTDAGENWQPGGSVPPETKRFDYRATADGEYWFAVRTVDARGGLHPAGPIERAALKVVVDTTAPRLSVELHEVEPGRVELRWTADDSHLDPTKLELEYLEPGETRWQTVGIVPKSTGRTAWSTARAGEISVRGTVADLAGNVGRSSAELDVRSSGVSAPGSVPDLRQPIAEGDPLVDPPPRTAEAPTNPSVSAMRPFDDPDLGSEDFPFERPTEPSNTLVSDNANTRPSIVGPRYEPQPTNTWSLQSNRRARVVNSRTFEIEYEVEDVGPSGLSAVEFYITTDDGEKWWRYGRDDDRRSPFTVTVPRDGVYGFTLRARSGVGLAAEPPQPGEKPAIVIAVDRTAPEVALLPVQQGTGRALNEITIRWTINDANPSVKPIALSYAEDANGPWEPITGWSADEGSHVWTVGPGIPSRFHIRLTARDAAGNVTRVQTNEPVLVDLKRPSARIVDVQSIDGASR